MGKVVHGGAFVAGPTGSVVCPFAPGLRPKPGQNRLWGRGVLLIGCRGYLGRARVLEFLSCSMVVLRLPTVCVVFPTGFRACCIAGCSCAQKLPCDIIRPTNIDSYALQVA